MTDEATPQGPRKGHTLTDEDRRKAAETRARRARERAESEAHGALTFRQRLGVSLSRLSQAQLDAAVSTLAASGQATDVRALATLANQAYGKPQDAGDEGDEGDAKAWADMTRAERAAYRAELERMLEGGDPPGHPSVAHENPRATPPAPPAIHPPED